MYVDRPSQVKAFLLAEQGLACITVLMLNSAPLLAWPQLPTHRRKDQVLPQLHARVPRHPSQIPGLGFTPSLPHNP